MMIFLLTVLLVRELQRCCQSEEGQRGRRREEGEREEEGRGRREERR